jgi:hypothetical protein
MIRSVKIVNKLALIPDFGNDSLLCSLFFHAILSEVSAAFNSDMELQ